MHISQQTGCPTCRSSKGEQKLKMLLDSYNIKYQQQKTFDDCINPITKRHLRFDFYLPDFSTLIEYDGEGHFKPIQLPGMHEEHCIQLFIEGRKRDEIKNKWAKTNNVRLIRIPYFVSDECLCKFFTKIIQNDW